MTLPIIAEPLRFDCKLDPGPSLLVGGNFCIFDEVVAGGGEPYHTIPWEEVNHTIPYMGGGEPLRQLAATGP